MKRMGFADRWVHLVMTCVRTVKYSVLINGQAYGQVIPTHGLRQGDPLLPYFFIMCAEGLSSALQRREGRGGFSGLPITHGGSRINHIFFANDNLLFCKAKESELRYLQQVLEDYERASGQKLNKEKTSIFFSRNTSTVDRGLILQIVGVPTTKRYEAYLGLPALIGRSRLLSFEGIKG